MAATLARLDEGLRAAIRHFWSGRHQAQAASQGSAESEARDRGARGSVTAGKHMDGFAHLLRDLLIEAGLTRSMIYCKPHPGEETHRPDEAQGPRPTLTQLPGWFRAGKDWDFVVIVNGVLVAAIEFKSQIGSFGNNFNNWTEEALGNAVDLQAAYREGAFRPSPRPWLGFLMVLEDAPGSSRPIKVIEPHFRVFDVFRGASYARRYEILLTHLVRERHYDWACLILTPRVGGPEGEYREPSLELGVRNLVGSLVAQAIATMKIHPEPTANVQIATVSETRLPDVDPPSSPG